MLMMLAIQICTYSLYQEVIYLYSVSRLVLRPCLKVNTFYFILCFVATYHKQALFSLLTVFDLAVSVGFVAHV